LIQSYISQIIITSSDKFDLALSWFFFELELLLEPPLHNKYKSKLGNTVSNESFQLIVYSAKPEYDPLLLLTLEQLFRVASFKKCNRLSLVTTSKMCCEVRVLASFEAVISAVAVIKNSRNRSSARADLN